MKKRKKYRYWIENVVCKKYEQLHTNVSQLITLFYIKNNNIFVVGEEDKEEVKSLLFLKKKINKQEKQLFEKVLIRSFSYNIPLQ